MMFGYVSLGGKKFEAFLWEDEEPEWFDCVILYSEMALAHEIVSLHFRVPAERAFVDEKVRENLDSTSTAIADKCKTRLQNNEKIGKKVSFALPAMMEALGDEPICTSPLEVPEMEPIQLSEVEMAMEVELMLSHMNSNTSNSCETPVPQLDGAMLYEAEEFGGKFVDESSMGGECLRQASTIKKEKMHLIEQFLDSPQVSLRMDGDLPTLPSNFRGGDVPTDLIPHDIQMSECGWSLDFENHSPIEGSLEQQPKPAAVVKRASSAPRIVADEELPPMDDEPTLGDRKAAFVSTRGKEKEIWQTYREEITATWRAELEVLRKDLFANDAHMGA